MSQLNNRPLGRASRHCRRAAAAAFMLSVTSWSAAQALTKEDFDQIDRGFRVFTSETFDGNGRTCGTCHVPAESYNIFPSTIRALGTKDRELVFARNVPGLENESLVKSHALFNISGNASTHRADEPHLFGTAGHTGPIFRSSMRVTAVALTSRNASQNFPGTPLLPPECSRGVEAQLFQLGWSGDAPPGTPKFLDDPLTSLDESVVCHINHGNFDPKADGSIRAFMNGAIAQHNTKSLNRIEGVDFRFATDEEADAVAAFQLWLGRRILTDAENAQQGTTGATEFDIARLDFVDDRIDRGRDHYAGPAEFTFAAPPGSPPGTPPVLSAPNPNAGAGCNACHTNGGATTAAVGGPNNRNQNININTDVELGSDDIGLHVVGFALPHDEGASNSFGPRPAAGPGFDESFNIQSVIEAAAKRAWFHNHRAVRHFEEALAFYFGPDFLREGVVDDQGNPVGPPAAFTTEPVMRHGNASGSISFPNGDGVEHLGAFLRALGAWYSLRDCERLVQEAIDRIAVGASPELAVLHCRFELANVRRTLSGSKLDPTPYSGVSDQASVLSANLKDVTSPKVTNPTSKLSAILVKLGQQRSRIAAITPPPAP